MGGASDFISRYHTHTGGAWPEWLALPYLVCHIILFGAFVAMPVMMLIKQWINGVELKPLRKRVRFFMASTLFLTAFLHIEGLMSFYWPNYYFFTALKVGITAWVAYVTFVFPALVGQIEAERMSEFRELERREKALSELSTVMQKEITEYVTPSRPIEIDDQDL